MKFNPVIVIQAVMVIVVLWVVYLILKRTGLILTRQERLMKREQDKSKRMIETERKLLEDSEYFNPNLYKKTGYGLSVIMPEETAKNWAETINDAWGWINDNEEQIYDVFRRIPNKVTISQVSDEYSKLYKIDLLADLINRLSAYELAFIYRIVDKKPIK